MEGEFFRVEVNDEGAQWLRKFGRQAVVILVLTILVGAMQCASSLTYLFRMPRSGFSSRAQNVSLFIAVYSLASLVLPVVQVWLYVRFAGSATKCIAAADAAGFNRSFRLLYLQSVIFLVQVLAAALVLFARTFLF